MIGHRSLGIIPTSSTDLEEALEMGIDWSLREGYAWAEDKEHCEEYGRMLQVHADAAALFVRGYPAQALSPSLPCPLLRCLALSLAAAPSPLSPVPPSAPLWCAQKWARPWPGAPVRQ